MISRVATATLLRAGIAGPVLFVAVLYAEDVTRPGFDAVRQYVSRTRKSVAEVRAANDELSRANEELAARNQDLQDLFQFAGGLAARAHDRGELIGYAESALTRLVGARASISVGAASGGVGLVAGGNRVGSVSLDRGFAL